MEDASFELGMEDTSRGFDMEDVSKLRSGEETTKSSPTFACFMPLSAIAEAARVWDSQ